MSKNHYTLLELVLNDTLLTIQEHLERETADTITDLELDWLRDRIALTFETLAAFDQLRGRYAC